MRKLVIVIAVLAGMGYGAKYFYSNWSHQYSLDAGPKKEAKARVERMIFNMQQGTLAEEEIALATWAVNKISLDYQQTKDLEPFWIRFWKASGLGNSTGWEISEMEVLIEDDDGVESQWVKVTVSSGSNKVLLKVEHERPIELFRNGAAIPYRDLDFR
jgi:hypothetical protein